MKKPIQSTIVCVFAIISLHLSGQTKPFPQNVTYPYGYKPTTISSTHAQNEYTKLKTSFLESTVPEKWKSFLFFVVSITDELALFSIKEFGSCSSFLSIEFKLFLTEPRQTIGKINSNFLNIILLYLTRWVKF